MGADRVHPDARWVTETISDLTTWLCSESFAPTSQVTGGGAVAECERLFASFHDGRPSVLVPNATYGMRVALAALGVGPDDDVLVPAIDWISTAAAVRSLGATPVTVPCDPVTKGMDARAASRLVGNATRAVVVCHPTGDAVDVDGIRVAVGPGVPVIEDAARAFGSIRDGRMAGTFGDLAVFSFGPGKTIDVGEAGMVVSRDSALREVVVALSAHPLRVLREGVQPREEEQMSMRPHPVAAVRLAVRLRALLELSPEIVLGGEHV